LRADDLTALHTTTSGECVTRPALANMAIQWHCKRTEHTPCSKTQMCAHARMLPKKTLSCVIPPTNNCGRYGHKGDSSKVVALAPRTVAAWNTDCTMHSVARCFNYGRKCAAPLGKTEPTHASSGRRRTSSKGGTPEPHVACAASVLTAALVWDQIAASTIKKGNAPLQRKQSSHKQVDAGSPPPKEARPLPTRLVLQSAR